jgi:hypothetical protein
MDKKLYDIQGEFLELMEELEMAEGEITPELEEKLKISEQEFHPKAVGFAKYIEVTKDDIKLAKEKRDRIDKYIKAKEKQEKFLKESIQSAMQMFGIRKVEWGLGGSMWLQKNADSYPVHDEELIPAEYKITKTVVELNRDLIKERLKSGVEVPGAGIKQSESIRIKHG